MIDFLKQYQVDGTHFKIHYFEMETQDGRVEMQPNTKNVWLSEMTDEIDLEQMAVEFIGECSAVQNFTVDLTQDQTADPGKLIKMKMAMASMAIATDGRIGRATHAVVNPKTAEKYKIEVPDGIELTFSEYMDEDVMFLLRNNNDMHEPGYMLAFNKNRGDEITHYAFVEVGYFPHRQMKRINIKTI